MVDFELDGRTRKMVDEIDAFVVEEVLPVQEKYAHMFSNEARGILEDGTLHPDLIHASRALRAKSAKRGYYALHLPEEVGGGGMGSIGMLSAYQAVYKHGMGFTLSVLASIEGPNRMLLALDETQREKYLRPLVRGEKTTCFALTEPHAGSDVRNIKTTARAEGDEWVLNGTKIFITNGPYADFAQVFAKTSDDNGLGSVTAFLVDRNTPGFTVGPAMETIANNGLPCELHFKDCRIPAENVIGGVGEGFYHAMTNINDTRIQIGGMSLGLARHCIDRTVAYVNQREAFGRTISKYQGVSFPLADSATELRAAEMLALNAAWRIDRGDDAIQETSMTKLYATEMLWRVADRCIQAHGGAGTLRERGLERILRWARIMRVFEGTSEIQRATIAKTMGL